MTGIRILHVAPYSPAAWAYGGIPRVVEGMTEGLAGRGHAVELWATDVCGRSTRLPAGTTGAQVHWRLLPNLSNAAAHRFQAFLPMGLRRLLETDLERFDIVHLHACHNLLTVLTAHACVRQGVPFVLSPNGTAPPTERRIWMKRLLRAMSRDRALEQAARVLAVSHAEAAVLRRMGLDDESIEIVPNPVGLPDSSIVPGNGFLRRRLPQVQGPIVLFLAKVTPRKNLPGLMAAISTLHHLGLNLVVAGSDHGGLRQALASASARGLEGRVHHIGALEGAERFEALADADVVAYPSTDEAFGLVACEALACGTPVVVGNDAGCGEIVRALGGGVAVNPHDVAAIADGIACLLADPATWRLHARAAGSRVRQRFSPAAVAATLERLYGAVLGREERQTA